MSNRSSHPGSLPGLQTRLKEAENLIYRDLRAGERSATEVADACGRVPGAESLQVQALCLAAWASRGLAEHWRAEMLLTEAMRKARQHQLPSFGPLIAIARATIAFEQGKYSIAVRTLVSLLADEDRSAHMTHHNRSRAYTCLADMALDMDAGDSMDLAFALADDHLQANALQVPVPHALGRVSMQLLRYLWCQDELNGALQARTLHRSRAPQYLLSAHETLRSIEPRVDDPTPSGSRVLFQELKSAVDCLQGGDTGHFRTLASAALARATQGFDVDTAERLYLLAAALLALGDAGLSGRLVEFGASIAIQPETRKHWWLHLRAAIAAKNGDAERSLALYKAYVMEASARMSLAKLDIRDLIEALTRVSRNSPSLPARDHPAYLQRGLEAIEANPAAASVERVAAHAGVSARTLREAFVVHVGRQPKEYIIERRLEAAQRALAAAPQAQDTIADIAQQCGFSNVGRFSRLYRRRYGESPAHTRGNSRRA